MTNKFLHSAFLSCSFFLLIPAASQACDSTNQSTLKREKVELSDINNKKLQAKLYNYRTGECAPLNAAHNELEIGAFLPDDETTLGIFQSFRNKGESQIDALKHTLEFNINDQQS
ncbi:MAG: hypothetical protein OEM38_08270 [Gammaproteobacteria bacterium]|nr:hypothetical protein [Gammaproteobacteria bacterium]